MKQSGFAPILVVILLAVVMAFISYYVYKNYPYGASIPPEQIACTMEAKICPDGTSVGRSGPRCEFAACPKVEESSSSADISNWQTYKNSRLGFEIKYPSNWYVIDYQSKVGAPNPDRVLLLLFGKGPKPETIYPLTHPWYNLFIDVSKKLHTDEVLNRTGTEQGAEIEGDILNKREYKITSFARAKANKRIQLTQDLIGDFSNSQIIFNTSGYGWTISYPTPELRDKHDPIYDQILSTFEFTQ